MQYDQTICLIKISMNFCLLWIFDLHKEVGSQHDLLMASP